jgi:hypothetical protein
MMQKNLGILEWRNEGEFSTYPLTAGAWTTSSAYLRELFVDARFIQFDGRPPVLKKLQVDPAFLTVTIEFDRGVFSATKTALDFNGGNRALRFATPEGRYLGRLIFGSGFLALLGNFSGQQIEVDIPFSSAALFSVNSRAGIYTIENNHGAVAINTDDNLFFESSAPELTWNVVGVPFETTPPGALKTINGVLPEESRLFLSGSFALKINRTGVSALQVSSVAREDQLFSA